MKTLLLLAMMQVPADTIRTEFVIPVPRAEVVRDTTPIIVNVETSVPDSVMHAIYRAGAADARAAAAEACACMDSGPPDWFWAGLLVLGTYGVYVWSQKDAPEITVSSSSTAEGGEGGDGGHHHGHPHKGKPHG